MDLDNVRHIAKLDKENMCDLLVSFPRQCTDALFIAEHSTVKEAYRRKYSNIVFTGLGGSAIGADIVKDYIGGETNVPIIVNRDYTMPEFVNKASLVFAVSYSGNTEETLSAYMDARKKRAKIIVITSGGRLKELALKNRDALALVPKGYPPRCALGYSLIPALVMLSKCGLIKGKKHEIKKAVQFLGTLQKKKLAPYVSEGVNIAKNVARIAHNRFPVVYSSNKIASVATRWRGQFAENAKTLASTHLLPEMNHNEIVGWVHPKKILGAFLAIMLRDKDNHRRVKKRMDITADILRKNGFTVLEIESQGKTLLERILSLIYIGDFTSFYLSILNKTNPTPVDRITYLKKQLSK
ncbi:MAG: bifunctional phosphoglucose/phosphomannose isomerase [Omnitrophica bacterium]|nr:bifunctional phosphoglucose/phosphomannose isomerase [Candidatus Omnitrophota bacterium]